jgi:hypothetical protein
MHALVALLLLFLLSMVVAVSGDEGEEGGVKDTAWLLTVIVSLLLALFPEEFGDGNDGNELIHRPRDPTYPITRECKDVQDIFRELGPTYTRQAYRMTADSFWNLHRTVYESRTHSSRTRK